MKNTEQLELVNQLVDAPITTALISSEDFGKKYDYLVSLTKYLEDIKKQVDSRIKEITKNQYYDTGENSVTNAGYKYTYIPESTKETFNTKEFKVDHPDLYKEYVRVSNVSDSVRTTKVKPKVDDKIIDAE